jgi:hypothetical protein
MGYRTKNDAIEALAATVGFIWTIGYVAYSVAQWTGVVVIFSAIGLVISAMIAVSRWKENRRTRARDRLPCAHGVDGAKWKPSLCAQCTSEQTESESRRKEERDAQKAREYAEWIKRIRLPEYLKSMHPQEFEPLICQLYSRLGYQTELTRYTGDGGVDGYLRKDGQTTILQCKRVQGSVGEPILRDLYGTMRAENASSGLVVTTGRVSKQARRWVRNKPIDIVELETLQRLISDNFAETDVVPPDFTEQLSEKYKCPRCDAKLRIRKGRWGKFWGCSAYPKCSFTRRWKKS